MGGRIACVEVVWTVVGARLLSRRALVDRCIVEMLVVCLEVQVLVTGPCRAISWYVPLIWVRIRIVATGLWS